jgi:hypothetical protein
MLVELQRERGQLRKLVTFKLGSNLMYPVNFFSVYLRTESMCRK